MLLIFKWEIKFWIGPIKLLCLYNTNKIATVNACGDIPNLLDDWADPVPNFLYQRSRFLYYL